MSVGKVIFHYFMSKYLVILSGSPRGGNLTFDSLYKYVSEHLSADIAVCTTDNFYKEDHVLFSKAKYKWILKNYDNFFDYYSENFNGSWRDFFELGKGTGLYESGSIHFIFKDFILRNYIDILLEYDFIVYTRFDQFYLDFHIEGKDNKILIPTGEDYFGICDRHAIIPRKFISKYLNICEYINLKKSLEVTTSYLNCETAYLYHLRHEGLENVIERYPRSQFTAALISDKTNWRVPIYKIYFFSKLMIKYPDEFINSFNNLVKERKYQQILIYQKVLFLNFLYLKFRRFLGRFKDNLNF
tara:strand:- start:2183 stop:3082 length:900 start_codon:yes stop_codon:yes gene_type:complete